MLTGCGKRAPEPVAIEASDMCARCKMAISERRYAAEVIGRDDAVFKFDDIGCMVKFSVDRGLKAEAEEWFVQDFDGGGWLDAQRAYYVQSPEIPAPMRGGFIALKQRAGAEGYAERFHGRVIGFDQLGR